MKKGIDDERRDIVMKGAETIFQAFVMDLDFCLSVMVSFESFVRGVT